MNQQNIFHEIATERERQDLLHPSFPSDDGRRLAILVEEVGEIAKAINEVDEENLREELIHVAAVCVRWLETMEE